MKKIVILMCAFVAAMAVSAQEARQNVEVGAPIRMTAKYIQMEGGVDATPVSELRRTPKAGYDDVDYYYVNGMKFGSIDEEWYGYPYAFFIAPTLGEIEFVNMLGPVNWMVNGTQYESNSETFVIKHNEFYNFGAEMWYLPQTQDHKYTVEGQTYSIKGYEYGDKTEEGGIMFVGAPYGDEDFQYVTTFSQCERFTSSLDSETGSDFYRIEAGDRGKYAYGSKLNVAAEGEPVKYPDAICVYVENPGAMYIDYVYAHIYSRESDPKVVFPDSAEIKMTFYPIVDGMIDEENVLAESVISNDENGFSFDEAYTCGAIIGKFYEINDLGLPEETPLMVEGDFFVKITGLDDCNMGIIADYYCPITSTYYEIDGEYTQLWSSGGSNLSLCFSGYMPGILNDTALNVMYGEIEGGEVFYSLTDESEENDGWNTFWTNVDPNNWYYEVIYDEEETEEWLVVYGFDDSYYAEYGAIFTKILIAEEDGESLVPAMNDGYDREAIVRFIADGATYDIIVKQAGVLGPKDPEGVKNVAAPVAKAEKIMKNGQLLIKKGDNFFNAMGQQVK